MKRIVLTLFVGAIIGGLLTFAGLYSQYNKYKTELIESNSEVIEGLNRMYYTYSSIKKHQASLNLRDLGLNQTSLRSPRSFMEYCEKHNLTPEAIMVNIHESIMARKSDEAETNQKGYSLELMALDSVKTHINGLINNCGCLPGELDHGHHHNH